MKQILLFFLGFWTFAVAAQEPVTWQTSFEKTSSTEITLTITATIEKGWHLYSTVEPDGDIVPIPTSFVFDNAEGNYQLLGTIEESEPITSYDKIFETNLSYFDNKAVFTQKVKLLNPNLPFITGSVEYQTCDDKKCIYRDAPLGFSLDGSPVNFNTLELTEESFNITESLKLPLKNPELALENATASEAKKGLFGIFVLGFLGGILALLTPCVFPMIPLTVSYFTKQSGNRKKGIQRAFLYGLFIVGIYLALSVPFHFIDSLDPEILNTISTNVWLNIVFFIIFVFFAFSFFGYYELALPTSWGNKMDSASGVGGFMGIFFMALTLAIVSFSCTGPILGSLLAGSLSADGGAAQLTAGMVGFGLALALPFALFALFPNWLQNLPKSGGWMNTVKVVLGFLELALALKFLSNADLVSHWGLLKREVFVALWIVIFLLLALYLFGFIRFPHDGPKERPSFLRIATGVLAIALVVYLVPGLKKDNPNGLRLLSGFPPPVFYSVYQQESDCPLGLNCFKDFDEGLNQARENNKAILLDFTGWACVNCRKMEENVWSKPEIHDLLKNDFVIISLYVDDRKPLPKAKQFNYQFDTGRVKAIETVGDKWATFQALNFKTASQPYYILMSPDFTLLNTPQQYTDAATYYQWLKNGLMNNTTATSEVKPIQ